MKKLVSNDCFLSVLTMILDIVSVLFKYSTIHVRAQQRVRAKTQSSNPQGQFKVTSRINCWCLRMRKSGNSGGLQATKVACMIFRGQNLTFSGKKLWRKLTSAPLLSTEDSVFLNVSVVKLKWKGSAYCIAVACTGVKRHETPLSHWIFYVVCSDLHEHG